MARRNSQAITRVIQTRAAEDLLTTLEMYERWFTHEYREPKFQKLYWDLRNLLKGLIPKL